MKKNYFALILINFFMLSWLFLGTANAGWQLIQTSTSPYPITSIPIAVQSDPVPLSAFRVLYSIQVPNIQQNEILVITSEFQASNMHWYNAGLYSVLILADSPTAVTGQTISPANGYDLSPEMHHGIRDKSGMFRSSTTYGPYKYINLVVYSMSMNASYEDTLTIDSGYGKMNVLRLQ